MKVQSISQNNTNFGQLHAPRMLRLSGGNVSSKMLLENPVIKKCAEKFDVYVDLKNQRYYFNEYSLKGVKRGKDINFETREHTFWSKADTNNYKIVNLIGEIEVQIREYLMRIVAENYPKNGGFKSKDILNILETKEVKNNLKISEVFNYGMEQSGKSTLLTKFFEINPKDDNEKDYDKVISILKSEPNINFNQKDNLGISVLENIFNYENEKALNLVKDCEFDYTRELDNLFNNIQNNDFKKKALEVKIKFPDFKQLANQKFSPESLAFLDSPFCDSKNSAVLIWLKYIREYDEKSKEANSLFNVLQKYLPEYYQNHYERKRPHLSCMYKPLGSAVHSNFIAPPELKLADRTISSKDLLENTEIRDCIQKYSVVVERGAKNTTYKKKVPRLFSFLPPKEVEESTYEYTLKGVKKGKTGDIETQKHLILVSEGIGSYIRNLVNEIEEKDQARFYEIAAKKHPARNAFTAREMLELLECDEVQGNYNSLEAFSYPITKSGETLLTKFFEIKETEENKKDYERLVSILKSTKNLNLNKASYLEKVFQLENTKALELFTDMEMNHSEWLDNLYKNTKDENFKNKARNLKIKFPDTVEELKRGIHYSYGWKYVDLSYLESPFCNSRKEAIRIWTELKTQLPLDMCGELNAMLYKHLPDNLRME